MTRAKMKYFAEKDGEPVELTNPHGMRNEKFSETFPGVVGRKYDSFHKVVGYDPENNIVPVLRVIEYKGTPSLHKCDARCINATGRIMKCECKCGGRYHGRGSLVCLAA